MTITLDTPDVGGLGAVVDALRDWQHEAAPMQLHPGDLGWFWQFGAEATAAAIRTWSRDGQILAIGLQDSRDAVRMTVAPETFRDVGLAHKVVADLADPARGVLPEGKVAVEAPNGALIQDRLVEAGWSIGEAWTPLRRDLSEPVKAPDLRVEVVGPEQASASTAVHRSSFGSPRFTDELWRAMTTGLPFGDARCLLGYDDQGTAVAEVTVWSAGPGKPGLLEPMGVHADHRGRGYGQAICVAAAAALQELGSSSALVCTPSANAAGIATYEAAGYEALPERRDRSRNA